MLKSISINKSISIAYFIGLCAVAVLAPLIGIQSITGVIVNAALFSSVILLGFRNAVLIAVFPSLIAVLSGTLPAVLAPMIPFIITGNILLMFIFSYLRKRMFLGIALASIVKFLFLYSFSMIVIKGQIAGKIIAMMSWPQLLTALGGGIVAYLILRSLKKI